MRKPILISTIALTCVLTGCSQKPLATTKYIPAAPATRIEGDTQQLFGESIHSWEVSEANNAGNVTGISMPLSVIEKAGKTSAGPVTLTFPTDIQQSTSLDHIDVEYLPIGIGVNFQQPVFAFRIYWISKKDQQDINCANQPKVESGLIVNGYSDPTAIGSICLNSIGERSIQKTVIQDPDHPMPYARENLGYNQGKMIFMEVEITAEKLRSRHNFTVLLPTLTAIGSNAQIPANFTGVYQAKTDSYDFSIWSFSNPDSANSSS